MESQSNFFASEQFQDAVKKYLKKLSSAQEETEFEKTRNQHIKRILRTMPLEADLWYKHCAINVEWIGSNLTSILTDDKDILTKEKIDDVFSICYRFLLELYLSMKNTLSMEFEAVRKFAWDNIDKFEDNAKRQIEFAIRDMPIAILKFLISHDNIESIKEFNKTSEKASIMRGEWNHDLDDRTAKVAALKDNLDKYKAAFNFVGLHQGFDDLVTEKIKEKNHILLFLVIFGLLIVSPIITEIVYIYKSGKSLSDFKDIFLIALVPTISLVAILIYFFRILLFNFNALKSQILQLELRKTLCRFIQNYVEYSTVIKQKDKDSLTKFENIVFSGIVSDDAKMPSTFDGVEQLANLIKSIKA